MAISLHRSWLHIFGFTVIIAFVVLDVEYPWAGLICLEASDQLLVQLREDMR
jgi:hypothetical protein